MSQRYVKVAKASSVWPDDQEWQADVVKHDMANNFVITEVAGDICIEEIPPNELYQTPREMFFDFVDDGVAYQFNSSGNPVFTRRSDGTRWVYADVVG